MEQAFLEGYANRDSMVHRLDPRVKIITFFSFIFMVVLTPMQGDFYRFLAYFTLLFGLMLFSRVPLNFIFQRSLVILPFVVFITIFLPFSPSKGLSETSYIYLWGLKLNREGLLFFQEITFKAWLSTLSMILLTNTTKFTDLLKGMEKLKVARIMIIIISFMYRYIFVFIEEVKSVQRAMQSRNFGGNKLWQWRMLSALLASIFLRTYEQSERVYVAMLARGFDGEIRTMDEMQIARLDIAFLGLFAVMMIIIRVGW